MYDRLEGKIVNLVICCMDVRWMNGLICFCIPPELTITLMVLPYEKFEVKLSQEYKSGKIIDSNYKAKGMIANRKIERRADK